MDLPRKFEDATSSRSINISGLDTEEKYPIAITKWIATKFGPTTLLTIHVSKSAAVLHILSGRGRFFHPDKIPRT